MPPKIVGNIRADSTFITDGSGVLYQIGKNIARHEWIDHSLEHGRGNIHTDNIEYSWNVLKRAIASVYIHVNPCHLGPPFRRQVLRFNERENVDGARLVKAAKMR